MEVKFNLNIKLILVILLIVGLIVSNVLVWRLEVKNRKSIIGIVNYLNRQQPQIQQLPEPQQPKEVKKDGK